MLLTGVQMPRRRVSKSASLYAVSNQSRRWALAVSQVFEDVEKPANHQFLCVNAESVRSMRLVPVDISTRVAWHA